MRSDVQHARPVETQAHEELKEREAEYTRKAWRTILGGIATLVGLGIVAWGVMHRPLQTIAAVAVVGLFLAITRWGLGRRQ